MNKLNKLTHNEIITQLCQAGYPTFLVGGAVRDIFAGFDPHDFDITTSATPEQIETVFPTGKVQKQVGKSFGVTLVDGTEVATFRLDRYPNGNGAKNVVVSYADNIHDDVARRDLTVNAMAWCSLSGDLIDDHEGIEDLKRSVIRFVGDSDTRINEDPNRIIRACRFLAKIQGTFAQDTFYALVRNVDLIRTAVAPERIKDEILKAMELEHPSLFFGALHLIGALPYVFPGMEECVQHTHGIHHKEDVWEHLMLAGDKVSSKFPLVRLAAFLHDVGKPNAYAHNSDGTFVGHEVQGSLLVNKWLTDLIFSDTDRSLVVGLVQSHMWGGSVDATPKAMRRLLFKLNELGVPPRDWLRLRIADRHANLLREDFTLQEIFERAAKVGIIGTQAEELPFSVNSLAVKGGDLIKTFNLHPGPIVGLLQRHLLDFVIENGEGFNTVDVLLSQAEVFLQNP